MSGGGKGLSVGEVALVMRPAGEGGGGVMGWGKGVSAELVTGLEGMGVVEA